MAHSKSAKKRIRQSLKHRLANRRRKTVVRGAIRAFEAAVAGGQAEEASARLKEAYRQLDRTAGKGVIHKNAAARKKAALARRLGALGAR